MSRHGYENLGFDLGSELTPSGDKLRAVGIFRCVECAEKLSVPITPNRPLDPEVLAKTARIMHGWQAYAHYKKSRTFCKDCLSADAAKHDPEEEMKRFAAKQAAMAPAVAPNPAVYRHEPLPADFIEEHAKRSGRVMMAAIEHVRDLNKGHVVFADRKPESPAPPPALAPAPAPAPASPPTPAARPLARTKLGSPNNPTEAQKASRAANLARRWTKKLPQQCPAPSAPPTPTSPIPTATKEPVMATAAAAPEITREITPDQRLAVRNLLDHHFDDGVGGYINGFSDQQVAEQAGVPRIFVERAREAAYGPIRLDPVVGQLREDEEANKGLTALQKQAFSLASRIELLATGRRP
jgi:hypothetical protein